MIDATWEPCVHAYGLCCLDPRRHDRIPEQAVRDYVARLLESA